MDLFIGNDVLVNVLGLTDEVTNAAVDTATVSGALLDASRNPIATFSLSYVSNSSGNYQGVLSHAVTSGLTASTNYIVVVTATVGANQWQDEALVAATYQQS